MSFPVDGDQVDDYTIEQRQQLQLQQEEEENDNRPKLFIDTLSNTRRRKSSAAIVIVSDALLQSEVGEEEGVSGDGAAPPSSDDKTRILLSSKESTGWNKFVQQYITPHMNLINVIVLGISFCTVFTAFNTTQGFITNLKSTAGFYALGILYLAFAITVLIAPALVDLFGSRLCLFMGSLTYSAFVLASCFNPLWPLYLSAAGNGIGGAILWTAHGTYLIQCSGIDQLGFYTGIFFAIFQVNMLVGNLLAGVLLSAGISVFFTFFILFIISVVGNVMFIFLRPPATTTIINSNSSHNNNHHPSSEAEEAEEAESEEMTTTTTEDQKKNKQSKSKWNNHRETLTSTLTSIKNTICIMLDKRLLLFIPIALHNGFSISVFFGVLPPIFGSKNTQLIGYCMAMFGISEIIGSILFGKLIDKIGKRIITAITLLIHVVAVVVIWIISAHPYNYLFFITTFICGMGDSGYNTSIYSILGSPAYFKNQASDAIAAFKLIQAISIGLGFVLSSYATLFTLQMILSVATVCAIVAWIILEFWVAPADRIDDVKQQQQQQQQQEEEYETEIFQSNETELLEENTTGQTYDRSDEDHGISV